MGGGGGTHSAETLSFSLRCLYSAPKRQNRMEPNIARENDMRNDILVNKCQNGYVLKMDMSSDSDIDICIENKGRKSVKIEPS